MYVTREEREHKNQIGILTKAKILRKCKEKISLFTNDLLKEAFSERLDQISKRVDATNKRDIIAFYDELQEQYDCDSIQSQELE